MADGATPEVLVGVTVTLAGNRVAKLAGLSDAGLLFNYKNKRSKNMFYHPYYRTPYYGFGYPYGYGYGYPYGNYGTAINAIGSQFNSQSLINTGVATGVNQIFSPTNIY